AVSSCSHVLLLIGGHAVEDVVERRDPRVESKSFLEASVSQPVNTEHPAHPGPARYRQHTYEVLRRVADAGIAPVDNSCDVGTVGEHVHGAKVIVDERLARFAPGAHVAGYQPLGYVANLPSEE